MVCVISADATRHGKHPLIGSRIDTFTARKVEVIRFADAIDAAEPYIAQYVEIIAFKFITSTVQPPRLGKGSLRQRIARAARRK